MTYVVNFLKANETPKIHIFQKAYTNWTESELDKNM